MASQFQKRLLGTVVIVALGVAVLPALLDGDKSQIQDEGDVISLRPDKASKEENDVMSAFVSSFLDTPPEGAKEEQAKNSAQVRASAKQANIDAARERSKTQSPTGTAPAENVVEAAGNSLSGVQYVVQLGALSNLDNVNKIVTILKDKGFKPFTQPSEPVANKVTVIFVGPTQNKQALQDALPRLKVLTGLEGQVREHKNAQ